MGERTIKVDTYGRDVDQLVDNLRKRGYITRKTKLKKKSGYYVFNNELGKSLNRFQSDAGLNTSLEADSLTLNTLANWEGVNPNLKLGDRDIQYVGVDYGPDIKELLDILKSLGYNIDPESIQFKNGYPIYSREMEDAVRDFRSKNKIYGWTVVDSKTAKKLKKEAGKK